MLRRSPTVTAVTAVAVVTAGLLAGCGGDDAAAPPAETQAPSAAGTQPTGDQGEPVTTAASAATAAPGATGGVPGESDGTTAAPDPTTAAVPEVLAFTATLVGGGTFDAAGLAGRPALLWFWAPF